MPPQPTDYDQYLRLDKFPHIWCPGCGDGIVLKAMLRAIDRMELDDGRSIGPVQELDRPS